MACDAAIAWQMKSGLHGLESKQCMAHEGRHPECMSVSLMFFVASDVDVLIMGTLAHNMGRDL